MQSVFIWNTNYMNLNIGKCSIIIIPSYSDFISNFLIEFIKNVFKVKKEGSFFHSRAGCYVVLTMFVLILMYYKYLYTFH